MPRNTQITINGKLHSVLSDPDRSLLSVLRDELDLTGSKYGCGEGQCGACTVLIDGKLLRSCITFLSGVGARPITTIEGIARNGKLHPVQEAFIEGDAMQCGYCTAGMIMSAVALLDKNPAPTDADIVRGMQGHICRCGTYRRIIRAITKAAKARAAR